MVKSSEKLIVLICFWPIKINYLAKGSSLYTCAWGSCMVLGKSQETIMFQSETSWKRKELVKRWIEQFRQTSAGLEEAELTWMFSLKWITGRYKEMVTHESLLYPKQVQIQNTENSRLQINGST